MPIFQLESKIPRIHPTAYVSDQATIIGDVTVGENASIWSQAVLRGDNEPIVVGAGSNVQEGAVLHTDHGYPLTLGEGVTVGHQAMLHGCTIEDQCLVGVKAIVLNGARVGSESIVGAGSLITEGKTFPTRSLILGSPAKAVREVSDEQLRGVKANSAEYRELGALYKVSLKPVQDK